MKQNVVYRRRIDIRFLSERLSARRGTQSLRRYLKKPIREAAWQELQKRMLSFR